MSLLMILQLLIVLGALWIGSRYGSLALGAISGIGLALLVFGFGLKPGTPPTDVIYIIIAAVTCAGIMQASGGMDWLIQIAERLLRKHPDRITFLAPLCTFFLTVLVGTGHVVYTLMPIICDIALKKGIRPERPCGVASIASQVGITCSPIAAAVVAFVSISNANGFDITIPQVLMISIPSCICGLMAAATASYHRGLDLDKDPVFQQRLNIPEQRDYIYGSSATTLDRVIPIEAKRAVFIFLGALSVIVFFAIFQNALPSYDTLRGVKGTDPLVVNEQLTLTADQLVKAKIHVEGMTEFFSKPLAMNLVIQIVMISAAALMIIFCKASPKKAVAGPVWQSGHLWHCLACRHLFFQLYGYHADHVDRHSQGVPLVHSLRILLGFRAHQLAGSRCRCHAAPRLLVGHLGACPVGCTALCLWLFLHSELSLRHCHSQFRPLWYHSHWQVFAEPLVHDAWTYLRYHLNACGIPFVYNYLLKINKLNHTTQ